MNRKFLEGKNETLAEYHMRIGRIAAEPIKEYLPGEFEFYAKTSGTTAQSKWVIHTTIFREIMCETGMAPVIMACSDTVGDTKIR